MTAAQQQATTPAQQLFVFESRLPGGDWQVGGTATPHPEEKALKLLAVLRDKLPQAEYRLVPAGGAR